MLTGCVLRDARSEGATVTDVDAELMVRVQRGDQAAFGRLVDRHKDALVGYLTRLCGRPDRAEDLAQETFLRLYLHRARYRESGKLRSYLYRIATNLLRSEARRHTRRRLLGRVYLAPRPEQEATFSTPQVEALVNEEQELVARALTEVPLKFRAPLVLHVIEGLSYPEVARALQCRENTVKSRISRARAQLRRIIEGYHDGKQP